MKVTLNQRHHRTLHRPGHGTTPDTSKLAEINPLADSKHATLHAEVNGGGGSPTYINLCRGRPRHLLKMTASARPRWGRFFSQLLAARRCCARCGV
jgi:hypothetical protein